MNPLFDKILIDIQKAETVTSSGIILSRNEDQKLEKATILKLGPDCISTLQEGDTILFKSYSSDAIELDGKEYSFIKEEDVLCTYTTTQ